MVIFPSPNPLKTCSFRNERNVFLLFKLFYTVHEGRLVQGTKKVCLLLARTTSNIPKKTFDEQDRLQFFCNLNSKKCHFPIWQVENSKIYKLSAIGHYFLCTLLIFWGWLTKTNFNWKGNLHKHSTNKNA